MTIFRSIHDTEETYITVDSSIANDERLSLSALGIWFSIHSIQGDSGEISISELLNLSPDSRDALVSGLKELEDCGYISISIDTGKKEVNL